MDLKRIISAVIGFPLVAIVIIFGNKYIIDICISIIAIMALYEYFQSFKKESENNNLRWIAYICALSIIFMHIIPYDYISKIIPAIIPISILVLFAQVIATNMKYNIKDIAITLFGICYIVIFTSYLSIIRQMENGAILIWYLFFTAWGTDTFAYLIGKKIRKTQI